MDGRAYYKVTDTETKLYKDIDAFLDKEERLRKAQTDAILERLPKFSKCIRVTGFNRIPIYEGFVFDNPSDIDTKVWNIKQEGKYIVCRPNRRTKVGKEMAKFLKDFERTSCWDVDELLNIRVESIFKSFYPSGVFKRENIMYIYLDVQYSKQFEENNYGWIEIPVGEMNRAIENYNKQE